MNTNEMIMNHIKDLNQRIGNSRDSANTAVLIQAKSIALLALATSENIQITK